MPQRLLVLCFVTVLGWTPAAADAGLAALVDAARWRRALPIAEAGIKANANDAEAAYQLSRIRMARGEVDAALPLAERAATLQPKNATYRAQVASVVGRQAQRANVLRQVGLARRVKREAEAAVALDPNHLEALKVLRGFYREAPSMMGGDKAQAAALLARIRAISPADGLLADAEEAAEAKQPARVTEFYRQAVAAGPAHIVAWRVLANHLTLPESRDLAAAEPHARELVRLAPARADSYATLAFVLAAQKRMTDLEATLAAAESQVLENLLFGVAPLDRTTYAVAALVLVAAAATGSYLPARRAARTDPSMAFRAE